MLEISAIDSRRTAVEVKFDKQPDRCPLCGTGINPEIGKGYLNGKGAESSLLVIVCRCPAEKCRLPFLAIYRGVEQAGAPRHHHAFFFRNALPGNPAPPVIPDAVLELSPRFSKIYRQASEAEHYQLDEVAGPGYRKALEVLVKDFLISRAGTLGASRESLEAAPLSQCIEKYVSDPTAKSCAKRATWLGNDETHYLRKWDGKDLRDLKILLNLVINAVANQLLAEKYAADMPG